MVAKTIVVGSPGTHFMHMTVKNVLMVIEMFCIILILNILPSKYLQKGLEHFSHSSFHQILAQFLHLLIVYAFLFNHWFKR